MVVTVLDREVLSEMPTEIMGLQANGDVVRYKVFDDLLEAIGFIQKICGKHPVFTMDERTANIRTGIGTAFDISDGDKPQQC